MSMWTEREINWVLENRWKQLSRQTGPKNFEVDWIGVQREIESGLTRRMRRELQVEPLILCLVQPAPSGTPAYKPRIVDDLNSNNKNRSNSNFNKRSIEKNTTNENIKKESIQSKLPSQEEVISGRTRRRRSAMTP